MEYIQLKDVCTINMGQSPESSSYNENGDGLPFFQGNADFGERYPVTRVWCNAPAKTANAGDILISVRAPIGALNFAKEKCCIGRGLAAITPDTTKVSTEFIYWLLKGKNTELNNKGTGSTFKAIGRKVLEEIAIPDIDFEEQSVCAANLEKVYSILQKRKQELSALDDLIKARFVEMFGDQNYSLMSLADVIVPGAGLSYGIVVPGDYYENGCPMVRPSDFKNNRLDLANVYRVDPLIEKQYIRTRLQGDEILVQVIGQPGQIIPATEACKGMNVTRNLAVVRPNNHLVNRQYLIEFLRTETAQLFLTGNSKQSTLKQLPLSLLKKLEVPIPPMELQKKFSDLVFQVNKSKFAVKKALDEAKILFDSLMQQYLV